MKVPSRLSRTCVQVRVDPVGSCVAGRPPWWAASRRIRVAFEWREWRRRPRCSGRRGAGSLRQVCAASPSRPVRWVTVAGLVTAMSAGAAAVTALLGRLAECARFSPAWAMLRASRQYPWRLTGRWSRQPLVCRRVAGGVAHRPSVAAPAVSITRRAGCGSGLVPVPGAGGIRVRTGRVVVSPSRSLRNV